MPVGGAAAGSGRVLLGDDDTGIRLEGRHHSPLTGITRNPGSDENARRLLGRFGGRGGGGLCAAFTGH